MEFINTDTSRTDGSTTGTLDTLRSTASGVSKVYIWANASPHDSLDEYGRALNAVSFDDRAVHIMMNMYMPLCANVRRFAGCKIYSVNRHISASDRFHRLPEFLRFRHMMSGSFVSTDRGELFDIGSVPDTGMSDYMRRLVSSGLSDSGLMPVLRLYDGGRLPKDYPVSRFGPTTGFQCYMLAVEVWGVEKVVLCNFSVDDSGYGRAASMHGIDFEVETYAREGCARLFI